MRLAWPWGRWPVERRLKHSAEVAARSSLPSGTSSNYPEMDGPWADEDPIVERAKLDAMVLGWT